jgi:glycosyltransferase involved in cell wall biosynthesis
MHALIISFGHSVTERHALMLGALKSKGWSTTFIGWDRGGDQTKSYIYQEVVDEFRWVTLPAPVQSKKLSAKLPQYYYRLWQLLSRLENPDLVIITHIALLPLAYRFSCPKIYDSFEFFSLHMALYFGPLEQFVWPLWRRLEALLVKQVDGVTTVDSYQGWLEKFFRQYKNKVQPIWNFPSKGDDPETTEVEALKEKYGSRQVIALVGGLMKAKGLRVALEAAALVKEKHPASLFLFIGTMKDDAEAVSRLISSRNLETYTLFLPFMPYQMMQAHLKHARIGLVLYQQMLHMPYLGRGTGRMSFTHMQAGIPIVAPDFGDIGAIIKEENCGILTDSTSSAAVAREIMHLLENPETAAAMGRRGRQAFLSKYNWELEEEKFLNFVEKIIEKGLVRSG